MVALGLHGRGERVTAADPELAAASAERQKRLQHLQEFYRIRLDAIDDAARAIAVRHVDDHVLEDESGTTVAQFQHLDAEHLRRCREVHEQFDAEWRPAQREVVAREREEVAALLKSCEVLVIAGGHVVSLLNRLRQFAVLDAWGSRPVIAWSAGAMTMAERIVLFHDFPPFGKNIAQVLDTGFGRCPGIVVMPDAGGRVATDDRSGIARFARRMAPADCVLFGQGAYLTFAGARRTSVNADRLTADGICERGWRG